MVPDKNPSLAASFTLRCVSARIFRKVSSPNDEMPRAIASEYVLTMALVLIIAPPTTPPTKLPVPLPRPITKDWGPWIAP